MIRVFEAGEGGLGTEVHVEVRPQGGSGCLGIGGMHHIAFRVPTAQEHQQWHEHLKQASLGVTPVIDRFYFQSIYFRVPGGVLFETATDGSGFLDEREDVEHLGETLDMPPFLEPYRAEIEKHLHPIEQVREGTFRPSSRA